MSSSDAPTIGVLSLHISKESKAILNAAEKLGFDTAWLRRENTAVSITDSEVSIEPEVDVVINRLLMSTSTQPAEDLGLARVFENLRPMLNRPDAVLTAMHKYAAAVVLAEAGVPVPDSIMALANDKLNQRRDRFGDQAVYKTAIGTHGGGTWRVGLDEPVNTRVGDRQAFLQQYIDQEGIQRDARVYVVGGEVIGAMYRHAPEGDWRTNVALGGRVEDASGELPDVAAEIARRSIDAVGLDYGGVDLIDDGDQWYVLEVNPTAGFRGLFAATGTNPGPAIVKLAAEQCGATVDDDAVADLARELDDSRPAAVPRKSLGDPVEPSVIGYIEEVVVSGTRGSRTVFAKSDTGATRSSIDLQLAAQIGTGPIKDTVRIKSGSDKKSKTRPVVDTVIGVGGTQHTVTASVEDRDHMDYPLLLGRDVLKDYHVDVTRRADEREPEPGVETEE
ncbi:RimK family alpha-L-glutamate ligase [Halobacteriaceae bacterium SHR40]|uniref:RimK family alpha-L-glutamate ligase n=1 Tax=Halovenus amylolytica TaxID=2500550 RepID=UPI000FE301EF